MIIFQFLGFLLVLSHFSMANSGGLHGEEIVKPRPMSPEEMLTWENWEGSVMS